MYTKTICLFLLVLCAPVLLQAQQKESYQYPFSSDIYQQIQKDSAVYWGGGIASTDLSFIGLFREGLMEYDKPRQSKKTITAADSLRFATQYHPVEARQYILEKAKQNRVVMFNEAHYNPRHRVFVTSLLKNLRQQGYTYLAAETFAVDSFFFREKHPVFFTGLYSREPQFGNMIREAISLGFHLYPYESTDTLYTQAAREEGEANHLNKLLQQHPEAKVIVYCGFDHIKEDTIKGWGLPMAGRLKVMSGIDPYTVDQVVLAEKADSTMNSPYYSMVRSNTYAILVDSAGNAYNNRKVDALLYSPPAYTIHNRENWVFENGRLPYLLDKIKVEVSYPFLAKVYLAGDDRECAIPVDIREIRSKEELKKTALALFAREQCIISLVDKKGKTQSWVVEAGSFSR
ncbi:hypothetical protein SAMN05421788_101956 [Filimonas lacunae]|uniref:Uncharacterized protein n=1 Tax=Filimonas lacunae TaxID=477680 RepID=A0A173MPC5_9BACT|nr:hypothetical protein [Filimonas lacunae]BAV09523.1 hypothetical protein FLA_5572 [Filimonas lacunae]SIS74607.1 hypothetical protein SAMN05421788_101956 [Filimonas lacunae]